MPTLRKFFKHFAPRLIGGSSGVNTSERYHYGGSGAGRLETIGGTGGVKESRKTRSQYMEMRDLSPTTNNDITADGSSDKAHPDNGSEKAILQTKTVEISYS
jgi:hypothetical protein